MDAHVFAKKADVPMLWGSTRGTPRRRAVSIPTIGDNARTQAKRLEQVAVEARDYIAVALDVPYSEVEVHVLIDDLGPVRDVHSRSARIRAARAQAEALLAEAQRETDALARDLAAQEVPIRDIAFVTGVSFQRVGQIVNKA